MFERKISALASGVVLNAVIALATPGGPVQELTCPTPAVTINLVTGATVTGDTTGKPDTGDNYTCAHSAYGAPGVKSGYTGGEDVYEFTLIAPSVVGFAFEPSHPDLRLLLLAGCSEGSCVSEGGCGENLAPGTYYLVVDGLGGAAGAYSLTPVVLPVLTYNRWHDCPECQSGNCGQTPDDASRPRWSFNSQNYCGTDCDFSLFTTVECGTELHVPFFDPETGHLQVSDTRTQTALDVVATNQLPVNAPPAGCGFTSTGTMVQWEDSGCLSIPCPAGGGFCGGGSDCRTNNQLIDVSMVGQPVLCGVFRLDFQNWGGWIWDAFANCDATNREQFPIYRDLCSAIANWRPRAELGIAGLTFDESDCAQNRVFGSVTVENVGCVGASGGVVEVDELPPTGNPSRFAFSAGSGGQTTIAWEWFPAATPVTLLFRVDPDNQIAECSEALGAGVSCGRSGTLTREKQVVGCANDCSMQADAGPGGGACRGESFVLEGGGIARCDAGGAAYRWVDAAGQLVPGCDWSPDLRCTVAESRLHVGKNRFTLQARCASGGCAASSETSVFVAEERAPEPAGNVLRSVRAGTGVAFQWQAPPSAGGRAHRLYRDALPALPLGSRALVGDVPLGAVSLVDASAPVQPGPTFYQLVERSCSGSAESSY